MVLSDEGYDIVTVVFDGVVTVTDSDGDGDRGVEHGSQWWRQMINRKRWKEGGIERGICMFGG